MGGGTGTGDIPTVTLCVLVKDNRVLLGMKKKKLGKGKYNAFGGKVEIGETIEEAALRELYEETGGKLPGNYGVHAKEYCKVGEITYIFPDQPEHNQVMHIYLVKQWQGETKETDEMTAEWFSYDKIPYEQMWDNDKHWLPLVLEGKKIRGKIIHDENNTTEKHIEVVQNL